ncbi:FixH family protein [Microvirga terrestris]|uniref:FixH family protein n=1 Tax=Microvirga terrestris TaxID=2791024 RepID=A0ABS0HUX9_9HYPH|nr:FixH family protein [Microvirga terrestris]MBF9197279.1 FixH family protein [Microvirga terrestris]
MSSTTITGRPPRVLTGRMVLYCILAFFGSIIAMNVAMIRVAVSSFSGVETESSYKAGLAFKNDVAAAHAQDVLHWWVEANLQRKADAARVLISARDADARALSGLALEAQLAHPTDKRHDIVLEFVETTSGQFMSLTPMPHGHWDLVITLKRADAPVFRSKNRISL